MKIPLNFMFLNHTVQSLFGSVAGTFVLIYVSSTSGALTADAVPVITHIDLPYINRHEFHQRYAVLNIINENFT